MSQWSPTDWGIFFLAASPFVAGFFAGVVTVIKALHDNQAAIIANTADRAVKAQAAAATAEKADGTLATIAAKVDAIHAVDVIGAANAPSVTTLPDTSKK